MDKNKLEIGHIIDSKSVAVVGNSSSLFEMELGCEIDGHDIVIRFNKAAPLYCNDDVSKSHGTKTDLWAFWTIGAFYNRTLKEELNNKKLHDAFFNENYTKIQMIEKEHKKLTNMYIEYTYPLQNFKNIHTKVYGPKKKMLSVGFLMLNWLSEFNPRSVSIYGFDFKKTPTFSELHRHETDIKNRIDIRCNHDYNIEETYLYQTILNKPTYRLIT
jgi:hypothetical protein